MVELNMARIEREVLKFDRAGWTRAQLAVELEVSERTLRRFLSGRVVSAKSLNRILRGFYLDGVEVVTYVRSES